MSYATYNMTIDIDDGYYIYMALETSNNVWVSKRYFSEYQYKLLSFKEESLVRKLDSTLVKHRAPCIAHRDGRPRLSR